MFLLLNDISKILLSYDIIRSYYYMIQVIQVRSNCHLI